MFLKAVESNCPNAGKKGGHIVNVIKCNYANRSWSKRFSLESLIANENRIVINAQREELANSNNCFDESSRVKSSV
jgi:hypothetical protein